MQTRFNANSILTARAGATPLLPFLSFAHPLISLVFSQFSIFQNHLKERAIGAKTKMDGAAQDEARRAAESPDPFYKAQHEEIRYINLMDRFSFYLIKCNLTPKRIAERIVNRPETILNTSVTDFINFYNRASGRKHFNQLAQVVLMRQDDKVGNHFQRRILDRRQGKE